MAEYIERGALMQFPIRRDHYDRENGNEHFINGIETVLEYAENLPAADVVPVVHGQWDDSGRYTFPGGSTAVRCTECGCALTVSEFRLNNWNYCPVCGAKMDGGAENAGKEM